MKVEGPKGPSSVQLKKTKKAERASGSGFAAELSRSAGGDDATDSAGPIDHSSGIAGVDGIFAAQSVDAGAGQPGPDERQRRAQRGAEILDRLEEIRRGLLMGAVPKDRLAELARIVRDKREKGADPVISRLLDEIELRAEVELAKLSRRLA
jgi:Class II flagellar assembly regulator